MILLQLTKVLLVDGVPMVIWIETKQVMLMQLVGNFH
jgi:hypothetical protein